MSTGMPTPPTTPTAAGRHAMPTSRPKKVALAAGVGAVAAGVIAAAAVLTPANPQDDAGANVPTQVTAAVNAAAKADPLVATAPSYVKTAPIMQLTAPPTRAWWNEVVRLAPDLALKGTNPATRAPGVTGFALLVANPANSDVASSVTTAPVVLVTTTDTDVANLVTTDLAKAHGASARRTHLVGSTVVIGPEWSDVSDYPAITSAASKTSAQATSAAPTDRPATFVWNMTAWKDAVNRRAAAPANRDTLNALLASTGMTGSAQIAVQAKTPNGPYVGRAVGVDPARANLSTMQAVIERQPDTPPLTNTDGITASQIILEDPTLSEVVRTSAWQTFKGTAATATSGPNAKPISPPRSGTSTVYGTYPLQTLATFATGSMAPPAGPAAITLQVDSAGNASAVLK